MTTLIYTGNNCQRCVQTYKLMDQYLVEYKTINVDEDPEAVNEIKESGFSSLPVVIPPDKTQMHPWSGFDLLKIKKLSTLTVNKEA